MKIASRIWLLLFVCIAGGGFVSAQERVDAQGCSKSGKDYSCDKQSFDKLLQIAKTVSVKAPRLDPASEVQLTKLAHFLGKTVRSNDADLAFVLSHPDSSGIYYGPDDAELAVLRVYYGATDNEPGKLVWVESYYGQPDTPWPIVVDHLARQFRKRFKR